jgi:hypothetical protein
MDNGKVRAKFLKVGTVVVEVLFARFPICDATFLNFTTSARERSQGSVTLSSAETPFAFAQDNAPIVQRHDSTGVYSCSTQSVV